MARSTICVLLRNPTWGNYADLADLLGAYDKVEIIEYTDETSQLTQPSAHSCEGSADIDHKESNE